MKGARHRQNRKAAKPDGHDPAGQTAEAEAEQDGAARAKDRADHAEAQALLVLAEWINCQGSSKKTAALMDRAKKEIPEKFQ